MSVATAVADEVHNPCEIRYRGTSLRSAIGIVSVWFEQRRLVGIALGVLAALAIGVVLMAGFVVRELQTQEPILPMRLFSRRTFSAASATAFFMTGCFSVGHPWSRSSFSWDSATRRSIPDGACCRGPLRRCRGPLAGALPDRIGRRSLADGPAIRPLSAHTSRAPRLSASTAPGRRSKSLAARQSLALSKRWRAAACTEHLRISHAAFVTPLHSPVHLAQSISSLDQLSRARIEVDQA